VLPPTDIDDDALYQFFAGYFHQDWSDFHGTWMDVVDAFVSCESSDVRIAVAASLRMLVREFGQAPAALGERVITRYGSFYDPSLTDGDSAWPEFLEAIAARIEAAAPA
jgi:hypothetical protein